MDSVRPHRTVCRHGASVRPLEHHPRRQAPNATKLFWKHDALEVLK